MSYCLSIYIFIFLYIMPIALATKFGILVAWSSCPHCSGQQQQETIQYLPQVQVLYCFIIRDLASYDLDATACNMIGNNIYVYISVANIHIYICVYIFFFLFFICILT